MHGQTSHLRQIAHGGLAAVVLPVGVGDEARRGVEGEVRRHGALAGRVVGQHVLEPQQRVEHQEAADMQIDHGDEVGDPALLLSLVDPGEPIQSALHRTEDRREEGPLSRKDARHVEPERLHERDDDGAVERDLDPAVGRHGENFQNRSGRTRA